MQRASAQQSGLPKQGSLHVVETRDTVYWSDRKIHAAYKHCEFRYGQARYKEVDAARWRTDKRLVALPDVLEAFP